MPNRKIVGLATLYVALTGAMGLLVYMGLTAVGAQVDPLVITVIAVPVTTLIFVWIMNSQKTSPRKNRELDFVVPVHRASAPPTDSSPPVTQKAKKVVTDADLLALREASNREEWGIRFGKGNVLSRHTVYSLWLANGVTSRNVLKLRDHMADIIYRGRGNQGEQRVKVTFVSQPATIIVPRLNPDILRYSDAPTPGSYTANLGVTASYPEKDVSVNLGGNSEFSLLIGGAPGSGKSNLLDGIIVQLAMHNSPEDIQFILADMNEKHLSPYERIPHVRTMVKTPGEMMKQIRWIKEHLFKGKDGDFSQRTVLIVDEADWYTGTHDSNPNVRSLRHELTLIVNKGRGFGVSVIMATQKPSNDNMPTNLRDAFPTRISGKTGSVPQSTMILGPGFDQGAYLSGEGHFFIQGREQEREFLSYLVEDREKEIQRIVEKWPGFSRGGTSVDDVEIPERVLAVFRECDDGLGNLSGHKVKAMKALSSVLGRSHAGDNYAEFTERVNEMVDKYRRDNHEHGV